MLADRAGLPAGELAEHLYVHYEDAAVRHAFRVAAGLDSMVVGEAQILGQLRDGVPAAAEADAAGRVLHELMQQALRVGKRVHAETGIDRAGQSVVTRRAADVAGATRSAGRPRALVVGAGCHGRAGRRHPGPGRRRRADRHQPRRRAGRAAGRRCTAPRRSPSVTLADALAEAEW